MTFDADEDEGEDQEMDEDATVRSEARARPGDPKGPEPGAEARSAKRGTRPPLCHPAPPERLASEPGEYAAVGLRGTAQKDVESGNPSRGTHSFGLVSHPLSGPPPKYPPTN